MIDGGEDALVVFNANILATTDGREITAADACNGAMWQDGAHCKGHNKHSIGICYEGGLDALGHPCDTRTRAQRESMRALLTRLHELFPSAIILGHRDLSPDLDGDGRVEPDEWLKSCPCFDALWDYEDLEPIGLLDNRSDTMEY